MEKETKDEIEEKNKIYGVETVLEIKEKVEFEGKEYVIREMNVNEQLKYQLGYYGENNIDNIIELVNRSTSSSFKIDNMSDEDLMTVVFLFNGILLIQNIEKEESEESDYIYDMDYSFVVLKVMKVYNYSLEEVYKLPNSIFWNMFNKIKVFEAEEDMRNIKIQTAIKSCDIKGNNDYSKFTKSLSTTIAKVMKFRITVKANLKNWNQYMGLGEIKKRINEEEKP